MVDQRQNQLPLYPGIRTRLTIPFLVVVGITAMVGVFVVTQLVTTSAQDRFNNHLKESAKAASNTVADIERLQLETLRQLAFTVGVDTAIIDQDTDALETLLSPVITNAGIEDTIVFSPEGAGIWRLSRPWTTGVETISLGEDIPELTGWVSVQNVIQGTVDPLGDKFVESVGEPPSIMYYSTAPVINDENFIVGGITIGISAETLSRRLRDQALSAITLFNQEGGVLHSTFRPPLWDGREYPEIWDQLVVDSQFLAELRDTIQADSSPIQESTIESVPHQTLYTEFIIRGQPIGYMGITLPSDFIVENRTTSRDRIAFIFIVLFVTVTVMGLVVSRSITSPVTQLVETTRAIRDGDLSKRVGLRIPDELGELSTSFDHMTDQLVQRNIEINELYVQQLAETARLEAILSSITDAVIVQNVDGATLLRNHAAGELLDDVDVQDTVLNLIADPEQLLESQNIELEEQFFDVKSTPVRMESGNLLGYVIVFHDITALVEAERLKDEMMKQMSHELRTPLSASRGYVELVVMVDKDNLQTKSVEFLYNSIDNMSTLERMVNQVIDVTAIVSSQFSLGIQNFDLSEMIESKVSLWKPLCESRDLQLIYQPPADDIMIDGDLDRLGQVIDHLLRNAYSYTLANGKIEVALNANNGYAIISIHDTGVGIDADEIDVVFERLYRGRSADAGPTDARGLGLGLYISRRIVEAHQGTILLESQPEVGTTVTVELPV